MNIYHLNIEVTKCRFKSVFGDSSYCSDVFLTLDEAIQAGKRWLKYAIQGLYYGNSYDFGNEDRYERARIYELEKMMESMEFSYEFIITEKDLEYVKNFRLPKSEKDCANIEPPYKYHKYNIRGELLETRLEYRSNFESEIYVFFRFPGPGKDEPNKFKKGDFVTLIENSVFKKLYIVVDEPVKSNSKNWGNHYTLATINFDGYLDTKHIVSEDRIEKYEGTMQNQKPLFLLLQKYYRSEIEISKETMQMIYSRKIILDEKLSWREVPELKNMVD